MKTIYLILFALLTIGCNETKKEGDLVSQENDPEFVQKDGERAPDVLEQAGNYDTLFNSPNCSVITEEEISDILGLTFADINVEGFCSFKTDAGGGKTWNISLMRDDWRPGEIERELDSFITDETGILTYQISETGDTYLCNQHANGNLTLYNTNYSGSVSITYGSVAVSRGFTPEERLGHRDNAIKLANALLLKHQR